MTSKLIPSVTTKGKPKHKTPLTLRGLLVDVDDVEPACSPQHVSFRCARCQFKSIFGRADAYTATPRIHTDTIYAIMPT
ncbi:hypothetical protein M404DRAFT_817849 [Pisolithus tinctorius Marx 270]|uniref:Uncharacterized protein n=1 Tax=Pisolithus tinctorius Marx 270 TaxID=870435 RepID=A0A0C3NVC2_PISTI|nr:hypothetical protein M404DRAFT_817849 [Pisolithus tinctorius Marx 270]